MANHLPVPQFETLQIQVILNHTTGNLLIDKVLQSSIYFPFSIFRKQFVHYSPQIGVSNAVYSINTKKK